MKVRIILITEAKDVTEAVDSISALIWAKEEAAIHKEHFSGLRYDISNTKIVKAEEATDAP